MKSYSSMFVLVLLLLIVLAGCAPGPNPSKKMASEHAEIAGFWLGVWHGLIAPLVFVASLFKGDLNIYEVHNNGTWYNFGYLFGLACFFGGSGNRASRPRGRPRSPGATINHCHSSSVRGHKGRRCDVGLAPAQPA